MTPAAKLAFLVVNMLFVSCVARIAAVRPETRNWSWTAATTGLKLASGPLFGTMVYQAALLTGLGGAVA